MRRHALCLLVLLGAAGCSSSMGTPEAADPAPAGLAASADPVDPAWTLDADDLEGEFEQGPAPVPDPLKGWNRLMFEVNDRLYFWVLKPVAQGYKQVMPQPVRTGVRNVFANLTTPIRFVSCMLQGKYDESGLEFGRFMVNSTWGVLGIWDPALEKGKIEPADEDFGQTLAVYGLGDGCYLVWPVFGPSTLRDSAGMAGDYFLSPTVYIEDSKARVGVSAFNIINKTSFRIGEYEQFKAASLDPYVAMREAYVQYRQKQVKK